MEEESNGELAFRDTLLKRNNGIIVVSVYRTNMRRILTNTYSYQSSHDQASFKKSFVSSLFIRGYSIITNKDDLEKKLE